MDVFRKYATDERKENEGAWQKVDDCELLVARAYNPRYNQVMDKLLTENQAALAEKDGNGVPTAASKQLDVELLVQVLAETILLGWKGMVYDGEPLEYNLENAKKVLRIKDFRVIVQGLSQNIANYRVHQEDAQAKN